jgi:hypothetical protein
MRVLLRSLRATYLTADPRSLGLFRISFGLVLSWDLLRRYQQLDFWYTNTGLLPNHTLLWRPPARHVFSLFFAVSTRSEAELAFALCAVVYALFILGYRTRLVHALLLICRVSLNSRLAVLENGGDMVMNLLGCFSLALPLGQRISLDACHRSQGAQAASDDRAPVVSLAMFGLLAQFSAIYFFNAISKQGPAWRQGQAVYYALHQDKYVTWFGVLVREQLSIGAFKAVTWSTLAIEWTGFALLITPVFVHKARGLAILLLPGLHLCFALGLNLGAFSPAMMSFFPLLLTHVHWEFLNERVAHCARLARSLQRVNVFSGRRAQWLLWAAGRPPHKPARLQSLVRWSSEAAVATLIFAVATEALNDNTSVPPWLRVHQPEWAKAMVEYPRLLQGWRMFAPNPPLIDSMIYVDATTAQGRRVDPYNEAASRQHFPAGDVVPERMDQSQFFSMYSDRIALEGYAPYRQAFLEWLLAYPQRTRRAGDCLVAFEAYYVSDQTPPPGEHAAPTPNERTRFLQYVAPVDGVCKPSTPKPDQRPLQAHSG